MEVKVFEGKIKEEIVEKALKELNVNENEIYMTSEEIKGGLFKSLSYKLKIIKKEDVINFIEEYLKDLLKDMGIDVTFESKIREEQIILKMYSDKNSILIGKNGQTLKALQIILKSVINKQIGVYPLILLDVENYKEKHEKAIERLAKNVAREVARTKVEAQLEIMNSYERRIVHNILTNFKGIVTISEGEEPNRRIVIKPEK